MCDNAHMNINRLSFFSGLRGVARRADKDGNGDVTKAEAREYVETVKTQLAGVRPAFIIGDLFPFLDPAKRQTRDLTRELGKANALAAKVDSFGG
jgi:hypothetical protein